METHAPQAVHANMQTSSEPGMRAHSLLFTEKKHRQPYSRQPCILVSDSTDQATGLSASAFDALPNMDYG